MVATTTYIVMARGVKVQALLPSASQPAKGTPHVENHPAAAVQIAPVLYSREGTVDKVVRKILEFGKQGVQFATFPETVVPYDPYFSFIESPFAMGSSITSCSNRQ